VKSLVGDYRAEHLFTLRQSLESYRHYQDQIQKLDVRVKEMMQSVPSKVADGEKPPKRRTRARLRGGTSRHNSVMTSTVPLEST